MSQQESLRQRMQRLQAWSDRVAHKIRPFSLLLVFMLTFTGKLDAPTRRFVDLIHQYQPYRIAVFYQSKQDWLDRVHSSKIIFFRL